MNRLIGLALAASFVLSGCEDSPRPQAKVPVAIGSYDRCHLCGMKILNYPGSKSQAFIKETDDPVKFCSVRDGFTFALQPENARRLRGFYVYDMAGRAWDSKEPGKWIAADEAVFVYGSRQEGVMGPEPVPFATLDAAKAFAARWGGRVVSFKDITLTLLEH